MSWWQKKLLRYGLRYGLQRTGLLEDDAIDLDKLDITLGRQNVIELKDVALNIKRIGKLAKLPPSLRLETARVLSLKLVIPADFYQSSIVVEVDGVEISAYLLDEEAAPRAQPKSRARSPVSVKTAQHRKTNRRLHSPPPYDPGGLSESEQELRIPTTQEVAKSFLRDESLEERRDIEALAASQKGVEESFASESSEGSNMGTGMGVGVPGFLVSFLQGIVDRFKLEVNNVEVKVETKVQEGGQNEVPVTLRLRIGSVEVGKLELERVEQNTDPSEKRDICVRDLMVDILTEEEILAELSGVPSYASSIQAESSAQSPRQSVSSNTRHAAFQTASSTSLANSTSSADGDAMVPNMEPTLRRLSTSDQDSRSQSSSLPAFAMALSTATVDADRYADARSDAPEEVHDPVADLDIQPGDDNISWGSRLSQNSGPTDDLWKSLVSEDDLPESLIIEPESAATPRAHSSRGSSPLAARSRRAESPNYPGKLQSPGSWPTLDSPERYRLQSSPGSWPMPDQSNHTAMEPLDRVLAGSNSDLLDNKQNALEKIELPEDQEPPTPPELEGAIDESMLQSRVFSHEEAQSIYMSVMTTDARLSMPGGWVSPDQSVQSQSPEVAQLSSLDGIVTQEASQQFDGSAQSNRVRSGNVTPRPRTPSISGLPSSVAQRSIPLTSKELIQIDWISISIPAPKEASSASEAPCESHDRAFKQANAAHGMPGTFSTYSTLGSSQWKESSSIHTDGSGFDKVPEDATIASAPSINVAFGDVIAQIDIPTGKLLYAAATKVLALSAATDPKQTQQKQQPQAETTSKAVGVAPLCNLHLNYSRLSFSESMVGRISATESGESRAALDLICEDVHLRTGADAILRIGDLRILLGGLDLLTFKDNGSSVTASHILTRSPSAIAVNVNSNRWTASRRQVMDISVQTSALHLAVDLCSIDQTFSSFGGLSGMLEYGSKLSESGDSSPVSLKPAKGVRFASDAPSPRTGPEVKLNARVGGITATLRGSGCAVTLRTNTMKAIHREAGTVATIDRLVLSGPYSGDEMSDAPLNIDLAQLRIEFLVTPHDKDLERLLSLLTPSKDQYDDDGDILIDTLLRQRRKGSILRAVIGDVKLNVADWSCIPTLVTLSQDLTSLSAVTKYLPEDDRPGLLSLIRVKEGEARFPVNERFGTMRVAVQDLHVAHVGLPSLLAFSIGTVFVRQSGGPDMLRPLGPLAGAENLPVIMGRMLGDEVEPTFKVKLFNICVEYSVPMVLDLTNMDKVPEADEFINELAQSVAALAMTDTPPRLERSPASELSNVPQKRMNISLLVHDSAIGLTPRKLSSKIMVVLSDAHVSTLVPPPEIMASKLELRKASIFVTDSIVENTPFSNNSPSNLTTSTQCLEASLINQGYVSIGSLRAMEVDFHARQSDQLQGAKAVEVDVRNQLFLLETCADSTQTLLATLSALSPPTPPSNEPRYLTQPMPLDDMMASFTGDAFVEPDGPPETLFDVEHDFDDDGPEDLLGVSTFDEETAALLAESEMTSSLYGPVSGVFDMGADVDESSDIGEFAETAQSLLEEDPFEMTISPTDMPLGDDALIRDLNKQCKSPFNGMPIDLGLYEIEDLGFDALGSGQQALGLQSRFNAPYAGKRGILPFKHQQDIPFRLKLRDFHVQWHLYDGYDWQHTRDGITEAVEKVEARAEERKARRRRSAQDREDDETVIGDLLFNSVYIGVANNQDAQDIRRQINRTIDDQVSETESIPVSAISRPTTLHSAGGQPRSRPRRRLKLGRSKNPKITFDLRRVAADVLLMPPGSGEVVSSVDLRLQDFEIFDKVPTSTWRKFLTHLESEREMSKPMFHIQLDNVKTLESHAASEIVLHVSVLPLRLHVDQDALDFITRFFEFKDPNVVSTSEPGEQPFLQRVEVDTVDMCLDYKPKNLDYAGLRSGKTTELMNIITLEGCNIRLNHAIIYGLRGFDALHPTLNDIWMPDVKKNQLPEVLAGLAPVRSLVNLGTGFRDVIAIPINEYKKDGRIVRSISKGAFQFGKTTTSELARLGAKLALGTQTVLANTEEFLSPATASARRGSPSYQDDEDEPENHAVSAYANQPIGVLSGLKSAKRHLEIDLLTARDAFIAVQGEFMDSRGPGDVVGAVARHGPTLLLRPLIGTARAAGTALLGVGNQIDRGGLKRVNDVSE